VFVAFVRKKSFDDCIGEEKSQRIGGRIEREREKKEKKKVNVLQPPKKKFL